MSNRTVIWVAVITGVIVAGAVASYFQSHSRGSDDDTALGVPEVVGTLVAVGDCPWGEASCILAQGIERALQKGNIDAVMELGASNFYICPGAGQGPMPLCEGSGADEGKRGYPVIRRFGEETVQSETATRGKIGAFLRAIRPNARDGVGAGGLKLYAFACDQLAVRVQPVSCAHVGIILSAIVGEGRELRREVLIFWAVGGFAGKTLPFTEVWDGPVRPEEVDVLFEVGGRVEDLGEVDVIEQGLR
jgi:hypothetical protein